MRAERDDMEEKLENLKTNIKEVRKNAEEKLDNFKIKDYTITAKEARMNADCTPKVFSRIMKAINEASKEGLVLLRWGIEDMSEPLIGVVKDKLTHLGYNVTFDTCTWDVPDTEDSFEIQTGLVIKW